MRETPGEEEKQKKAKNDKSDSSKQKDDKSGGSKEKDDSEWRTVGSQKDKRKKKQTAKENTREQERKPIPRRGRTKGEALLVEPKAGMSYADLLRKVRSDPELKELGENVSTTRQTQSGGMLILLKRDLAVKSVAFKTVVEKVVGDEAGVKALCQESVIECRDLDEITTEEELRHALQTQCDLGDAPMQIRLRKAYRGTQTAAIRLSTVAAKKLIEKGRVKVGWSVCSLRATPRVSKQMERCYKCMGFGHQSRNCEGPDRSDLCRKCGERGHVARDCTKQPRCLLCEDEGGRNHTTGGYKCPVYQKARAGQR